VTDGRFRVGVLVSGQGTNLRALLDATTDPEFPAQVVMVCANRPAAALEYARRAGIAHAVFRRDAYLDRPARDAAMAAALAAAEVELVVCAGYDAILSPGFVDRFAGRIINIHPSLLPAFANCMDAPARAIAAGVPESGCTVHQVTNDIDAGPILAQRRVPVHAGDTPESLHDRIRQAEHRLLPDVVRQLSEQRIPVSR
jgi:phosphoribosylglycinamide formyltransferase-1